VGATGRESVNDESGAGGDGVEESTWGLIRLEQLGLRVHTIIGFFFKHSHHFGARNFGSNRGGFRSFASGCEYEREVVGCLYRYCVQRTNAFGDLITWPQTLLKNDVQSNETHHIK
jgi:hypothetical protein